MERYDPEEQDWIVFNNFWTKEVSEKVKKEVSEKAFFHKKMNFAQNVVQLRIVTTGCNHGL